MARKRSPEKKEEIRKAAIKLISKIGFYNCTTDKIAEEAGVSVGTIYNYFEDKADILSYIFKIEQKNLSLYFEKLKEKDINSYQKIKFLLKEYYIFIYQYRDLFHLTIDEINKPVSGLTEEIITFGVLIHNYIQEIIDEGITEGNIRDDLDTEIMSSVLIGAANSVANMAYLEPEKMKSLFEKAPDNIFKIFEDGIFI